MTQVPSSTPNIHRLSRDRSAAPPLAWKSLLLIGLMVFGLLAVLGLVFGERLKPAVEVEVGQAILLPLESSESAPMEASQTASAADAGMQFQSSGWIEADPWLVRVPILADGFVDAVLVKEGDRVTNGQVLARMIDTDARLEFERQEIQLQQLEAELVAHCTGIRATEQEVIAARAREQQVAVRLFEANDRWQRISGFTQGEVSQVDRVTAERAVKELEASVKLAEVARVQSEILLQQERDQVEVKQQQIREVSKRVEVARLRLDRMVIRAPIDGVVQQRMVEPGAKRMMGMDHPDSATAVTLFDPAHLQVRVDVPLAEAGKCFVGQSARVSTAMLPGKEFVGEVTRIGGEADLQRNTLQVKVRVTAPDVRLRPEVLCRVEFFGTAPALAGSDVGHPSAQRGVGQSLWIPQAAVADATSNSVELWVVDPFDQTVSARAVTLGPSTREAFREVTAGLEANQMIVVHASRPLQQGMRVRFQKTPSPSTTGDR